VCVRVRERGCIFLHEQTRTAALVAAVSLFPPSLSSCLSACLHPSVHDAFALCEGVVDGRMDGCVVLSRSCHSCLFFHPTCFTLNFSPPHVLVRQVRVPSCKEPWQSPCSFLLSPSLFRFPFPPCFSLLVFVPACLPACLTRRTAYLHPHSEGGAESQTDRQLVLLPRWMGRETRKGKETKRGRKTRNENEREGPQRRGNTLQKEAREEVAGGIPLKFVRSV